MKDDNLKSKLEGVKIPLNCTFLQTKKTTSEIFLVFPWLQHNCKMQSIQKTYVASINA